MPTSARMQLLAQFLQVQAPGRGSGRGSENYLCGHTFLGGTGQHN